MRRIFYLTCALIAFGSLYPFHFQVRDVPGGLPAMFLASLHAKIDRGFLKDVLVNLTVYIPIGFFYVLDELHGHAKWVRLCKAALAGMVLSACMESLQYVFPPRDPSLFDLMDNTISAGFGGVLGLLFAAQARRAVDRIESALGHPSSALFLLLAWGAAWFCPGDWGRPNAIGRLRAMIDQPNLHPLLIFMAAAQWIAIGALVRAVVGRERARGAFAAVAALTCARVLIPGQPLNAWEWAGMAIALAAWSLPAIERRLTASKLAALLALALLVEELRPWHFDATAGTFLWLPFGSMLSNSDWSSTLPVLFRKSALYGTAVWSLVRTGLGPFAGTVWIAVLLAVGEAAQLFVPGRTAESTDAVLALILGAILYRLEHKFGGGHSLPAGSSRSAAPRGARRAEPVNGTAPRIPAARPGPAAGPKVWTGGRRRGF
jgi:VanZ family protein